MGAYNSVPFFFLAQNLSRVALLTKNDLLLLKKLTQYHRGDIASIKRVRIMDMKNNATMA